MCSGIVFQKCRVNTITAVGIAFFTIFIIGIGDVQRAVFGCRKFHNPLLQTQKATAIGDCKIVIAAFTKCIENLCPGIGVTVLKNCIGTILFHTDNVICSIILQRLFTG